jgi:betaine-aldehyde dehydrogenase
MSVTAALRNQLFIGGNFVSPQGGKTFEVINPATEEVLGHAPLGETADIDAAVQCARASFDSGVWSSLSGTQRAVVLRRVSELVKQYKPILSEKEARNCGKPHREAEWDIDDVAGSFDYFADLAEQLDARQGSKIASPDARFDISLQFQPVGVVGAIVPWNYPLLMCAWKLAPALAAGCSVVLKPSELTPFTALDLAAIIHEAGLPSGVLSIVTGLGVTAGSSLTEHPLVDKLTFTGSVPTGSRVMAAAARDIKNVSLELGGKSPIIIFPDVDIDTAVEWLMFGIFWTNGQICSATSRAIIHKSILPAVLEKLKEQVSKIHVGDPFSEQNPSMGPLVNRDQHAKVMAYIEGAKAQGATLVCGGKRPENCPKGFYLEPTVFIADPSMTIWKEEIFGPVLAVTTFETEAEAISLANTSDFGLAAAVLSSDSGVQQRVVKAMRCGIMWVNCSQPAFCCAPWGGLKKSGTCGAARSWAMHLTLPTQELVAIWGRKGSMRILKRSKSPRTCRRSLGVGSTSPGSRRSIRLLAYLQTDPSHLLSQ